MHRLHICIIDLVNNGPTHALGPRLLYSSYTSIMPQVVGVWCKQEGHDVIYIRYTGFQNLIEALPEKVDIVIISAFTFTAQLAYALSNLFRTRGAVTVLGGPHARCYPEDACQYFDYVLGFTDKQIVHDILSDNTSNHPVGIYLSAKGQPSILPGVQERWEFIKQLLYTDQIIKIVPMNGSFGCPYSCDFCIDAFVPYQPLDFDVIKEDLRFLLRKMKRPRVAWFDPNFGVRFNDFMDNIEEAVPPNSIDFIAECTLSLLSEPNVKRLKSNGFKVIMPGIESWFAYGNKSMTGRKTGIEKVRQVADQVNMIQSYIPYVQVNFLLGVDADEGPEPFDLIKTFIDLAPGVYPSYALLTAFGRGAPQNIEYQRSNRVLPFPFHFLRSVLTLNVRPKNYSWPEFYDQTIDLLKYSFSLRSIYKRFKAIKMTIPRWVSLALSISIGGYGKIKYHSKVRHLLDTDSQFRSYFEQETQELPRFFVERFWRELGPMGHWLPEGAIHHDPNAYLKSVMEVNPD